MYEEGYYRVTAVCKVLLTIDMRKEAIGDRVMRCDEQRKSSEELNPAVRVPLS